MVDEKDIDMEDFEEPVVVMVDEEGNEFYYREDMIIPVGEKKFAVLVSMDDECAESDCECGDSECDCDDVDVFIARIDTDDDGKEVYVDPTDEEFEQVRAAYAELMEDEEDEEE